MTPGIICLHVLKKSLFCRYEILMVSMAPPEGEEEHSQAYYVIKVSIHHSINVSSAYY